MEELFNPAQTRKVYTVSELSRDIRSILETSFAAVWVEGEVSGYSKHTSGHIYFSLKDEQALVRCAFFKGANRDLKFKLEDGLKILCLGKVGFYAARGDCQLYVEKIEPKGIGALQLAYQQLKERLQKEGLFEQARKRPIPLLPERIGIVTSPSGAAIHDMLKVLRKKFSNVEVLLYPSKVQGEGAAEDIARAIDDFNEYNRIDVMIIGRGGGSIEDLWAFNEEIVARAIYRSKIPVISAVGHEVDYTIADFVADLRAPTPSAAAELVIAKKEDLITQLEDAVASMGSSLETAIKDNQQYLDTLTKDAATAMIHFLELEEEKFKTLIGKLEALSPLAILSRGYSITVKLPGTAIVRKSSELKAGERIHTKLFKGAVLSKVESVE
ncbi:MAG: exodeoxyribonuclease VII large subunit [Candidatus Omnitrophota bacterium]